LPVTIRSAFNCTSCQDFTEEVTSVSYKLIPFPKNPKHALITGKNMYWHPMDNGK